MGRKGKGKKKNGGSSRSTASSRMSETSSSGTTTSTSTRIEFEVLNAGMSSVSFTEVCDGYNASLVNQLKVQHRTAASWCVLGCGPVCSTLFALATLLFLMPNTVAARRIVSNDFSLSAAFAAVLLIFSTCAATMLTFIGGVLDVSGLVRLTCCASCAKPSSSTEPSTSSSTEPSTFPAPSADAHLARSGAWAALALTTFAAAAGGHLQTAFDTVPFQSHTSGATHGFVAAFFAVLASFTSLITYNASVVTQRAYAPADKLPTETPRFVLFVTMWIRAVLAICPGGLFLLLGRNIVLMPEILCADFGGCLPRRLRNFRFWFLGIFAALLTFTGSVVIALAHESTTAALPLAVLHVLAAAMVAGFDTRVDVYDSALWTVLLTKVADNEIHERRMELVPARFSKAWRRLLLSDTSGSTDRRTSRLIPFAAIVVLLTASLAPLPFLLREEDTFGNTPWVYGLAHVLAVVVAVDYTVDDVFLGFHRIERIQLFDQVADELIPSIAADPLSHVKPLLGLRTTTIEFKRYMPLQFDFGRDLVGAVLIFIVWVVFHPAGRDWVDVASIRFELAVYGALLSAVFIIRLFQNHTETAVASGHGQIIRKLKRAFLESCGAAHHSTSAPRGAGVVSSPRRPARLARKSRLKSSHSTAYASRTSSRSASSVAPSTSLVPAGPDAMSVCMLLDQYVDDFSKVEESHMAVSLLSSILAVVGALALTVASAWWEADE